MFCYEEFEQTLCNFAMCLFREAGHTDASLPIYTNHSIKQAIYFDSQKDIVLSRFQRETLFLASNISFLFELTDNTFDKATGKNVAFYSANLCSTLSSRSQDAHNVHALLRRYWDCAYSVVMFYFDCSVILSFADGAGRIILSDCYNIDSDLEYLSGRMDISNVSLYSADNYLSDLVYSLARWYYIQPISPEEASYNMFPIDYFASSQRTYEDNDRERIKEMIRSILCSAEDEYNVDYVAPDDQELSSSFDLEAEIDLLGLELEIVNDEEFETDLDDEEIYYDNDEFENCDTTVDEYMFEDVDPEIFNDPALMVKWLERKEKRAEANNESEILG